MAGEPLKHYHAEWQPGDNIHICFDDKTADARTPDEIDAFFTELRAVANKHDFDLSSWGDWKSTLTYLKNLDRIMQEHP